MFETSATYPNENSLKKAEKAFRKSRIVRETDLAIATGTPVWYKGGAGIGKTSFMIDYATSLGKNVVLIHLPTFDVDRAMVSVPEADADGSRRLVQVVWTEMLNADVIILDELSRAKPQAGNMIMEIVQNKTLGGHPLKEGVAFVACDNFQGMAGVISTSDLAQASRWRSITLQRMDTPWQIALASKYKDVDLSDVFNLYNNLEGRYPGVLDHLEPRTLEHVIWNIIHDLPAVWGLPLMAGPRATLVTKDGNDVTVEVLRSIAEALGRPFKEAVPGAAAQAISAALEHGVNVMLQGDPGIGKTEYVKSQIREAGLNSLYWNLPNIRPDRHIVPFPNQAQDGSGNYDGLSLWISDQLNPSDGSEYVMIADEYWRASLATSNIMLELSQGGRIGGMKVPMRSLIAMTNPVEVSGVRQNVGRPDRAMADRFFCSVDLRAEDIPANDYLLNKYGDVAEPFIEWHKEDIDDVARVHIGKRTLEQMIRVYQFYLEKSEDDPTISPSEQLDYCRPYLRDGYVPVPLHDLKTRLANRTVAHLTAVVKNKDKYIERMKKEAVGGNADQEAHIEVAEAIRKAELTQIEANHDALIELVAHLDKGHRTSIAIGKTGKDRAAISKILVAATKVKKAAA